MAAVAIVALVTVSTFMCFFVSIKRREDMCHLGVISAVADMVDLADFRGNVSMRLAEVSIT